MKSLSAIFLLFALSKVIANPILIEETTTLGNQKENPKIYSLLISKLKDNIKILEDNVNYLKYNLEKQPIIDKIKDISNFKLIEENANYIKNQTIDNYFKIIDTIFDNEIMNELIKNDKLNNLDNKLELLNNMRNCLINLLQHTFYQNLNELFKVIATYINLIDSTIIKLELNDTIDLSSFKILIKDVLKFVQKFTLIFDDEKNYKCENINIF